MTRYAVAVQEDHLARLVGRPTTGLIELIWNAFDADANVVEVELVRQDMGGIEAVRVRDDGHGMTPDEAHAEFVQLGGSWKSMATGTRGEHRSLHGKTGQGRWRAFGIGGSVLRWESVAEVDGKLLLTVVEITRDALGEVEVSDPVETSDPTGTVTTVDGISEAPVGLVDDATIDKITATFALHLDKYPIRLVVDGRTIDPSALEERRFTMPVPLDSPDGDAELVVVEWKRDLDRTLYLCDEKGIVLSDLRPGVPAPGFSYSAYLRWAGFRSLEHDLPFSDHNHPILGPVVESARQTLREYFKERTADLRRSLIEQWKDDEVYPYREPPSGPIQQVEHDLFEIVAVTAAPAVNATLDRASRKLSLELLKSALETRPASVSRLLSEVLHLSDERAAELDALLDRVSLGSIISASKKIADRLDFVAALEILVLEPETRVRLKERAQLHRILAHESWIFGEEFAVGVDDRSLREVLRRHVALLGRDKLADESEDMFEGKRQIVDLMLWRAIPQTTNRLEHLVVELKRPSVRIGADELTQIKNYAYKVADDPRFNKTDVHWEFIVVSTELDKIAARDANQRGKPRGLVHDDNEANLRVWALEWGEIIENCRHRLKYVQEALGHEATEQTALDYLRETYEKYLPENLAGERTRTARPTGRRPSRVPDASSPPSG